MLVLNVDVIRVIVSNTYISVLLYIILLDIFSGTIKGVMQKKINSHIGLVGLMKHSLIMMIVVIMGMFAPILKFEIVYDGLVLFFIVQYLISVMENCLQLGIPIPAFICERLNDYQKLVENLGGKKNDE